MFRWLAISTMAASSVLTALWTPAMADVVTPNGKVLDCYCTDTSGSRVELGQTICLFVDGRAYMAQCQMSLNVPMWREVQEGCMSSGISSVPPKSPLMSVPAPEHG